MDGLEEIRLRWLLDVEPGPTASQELRDLRALWLVIAKKDAEAVRLKRRASDAEEEAEAAASDASAKDDLLEEILGDIEAAINRKRKRA